MGGRRPPRPSVARAPAAAHLSGPRGGPERLYGRNAVREAVRGRRQVLRVWVASGRAHDDLVADLEQAAAEADEGLLLAVTRVEDGLLAELAGTADHQGVVAEVGGYRYADVETVLADDDVVLVLDRVQDPHNLGAIIRTAEEAGAAVVIPRHRAATVTPAVVRASAGATEHARVAQVRNLSDFLTEARRRGFWVYGAEAGTDIAYTGPDYRGRVVVVMGSEGAGLAPRVRGHCDQLVYIPLFGRVGSLNVSVAAGVVLFEVLRQRSAPERGSGPRGGEGVSAPPGART